MSQREATTAVPEDKPKTITKFKRRISRILGKDEVKRATGGTASTDAPTAATDTKEASKGPAAPAASAESASKPKGSDAKAAAAPTRPKPALSAAEHAKIQEEKVRQLFAKYNVTLEIGEWTPPFKSDLPRVEKKIRMRVHRQCHRCRTQLGIDKVCSNCKHTCCKKCTRYPARKSDKAKTKEGVAESKGDAQAGKKPVTQRSRMICHECQSPFKSKSKECANCKHERCSQCQREKLKGEGISLPRSFIKWTCHECENVHRDPENPCLKCGHSKCDRCNKEKVQRPPPAPAQASKEDGKIKDLAERVEKVGLGSQASAA